MSTPTLKSFISEKEIEEVKRKKQEEWERVRKPDQPLGNAVTTVKGGGSVPMTVL